MGTILKEKEAYSWLSLVYCKPMSFFFLINYSLSKQHGLHNLLKAYLPLFFRTFFISSFSDCHLSTFCSFFSFHNCTIFRLSFANLTCQFFVHFFPPTIVPFWKILLFPQSIYIKLLKPYVTNPYSSKSSKNCAFILYSFFFTAKRVFSSNFPPIFEVYALLSLLSLLLN